MISLKELSIALKIKDIDAIIKDIREIAKYQTSVQIQCGNGHNVKILIKKIIENIWSCRNCNQVKNNIEMFVEIAKDRGGLCLSEKYLGLNKHLIFECKINHKWNATPNNIKNKNSWCPQCKDLVNQERCRVILEVLLEHKFIICSPNFLYVEETKKYLELDGYCNELKIAFEYQGIMHYELMYWDHNDDARLKHQQVKDAFKVKKCLENNILLLVISYKDIKHKNDDIIKELLINMLEKNNIKVCDKNKIKLTDTNIQQLVVVNNTKIVKYKEDIREILATRNGTLKDESINIIHNRLTKFIVVCIFGHEFETTRERLIDKRKRWCKICALQVNIRLILEIKNKDNNNFFIVSCDRFGICSYICKICNKTSNKIFTSLPNKCHDCDINNIIASTNNIILE